MIALQGCRFAADSLLTWRRTVTHAPDGRTYPATNGNRRRNNLLMEWSAHWQIDEEICSVATTIEGLQCAVVKIDPYTVDGIDFMARLQFEQEYGGLAQASLDYHPARIREPSGDSPNLTEEKSIEQCRWIMKRTNALLSKKHGPSLPEATVAGIEPFPLYRSAQGAVWRAGKTQIFLRHSFDLKEGFRSARLRSLDLCRVEINYRPVLSAAAKKL